MTDVPPSPAIRWQDGQLHLLDQRLLPAQQAWICCNTATEVADAIHQMVVRGAPAIGISAAYGVALAASELGDAASTEALEPAISILAASRPTAVNLFWALEAMRATCREGLTGSALSAALLSRAQAIHAQDIACNEAIGAHGASLLPAGSQVYTHCNTGALATGGHGTALGVIRSAWQQQRLAGVFAGETRPWMQGARLTAWELQQDGIPVTLVTDSCAGYLMANGEISAVITGADRITANGDTANKIGTYSLAVLARHHGIPFYVAAPCTTVDMATADGSGIAIEHRDGDEVACLGGTRLAPEGIAARNPVFDVTPAALISAIITERGIIEHPDSTRMAAHMEAPTP